VGSAPEAVHYGPASSKRANPKPSILGARVPGTNEAEADDVEGGKKNNNKNNPDPKKGDEEGERKILTDKNKKNEHKVGEMVVHTESQKCGVITLVKEDSCNVVFNDGSHDSIPSNQIELMGQPKTFMSSVPSLGVAGRTPSTRVLYGKEMIEGSRVLVKGQKGVVIGFPTMAENEQKARVLFDSGREEVVDFATLVNVEK
jgi:hypothetical protein